MFDKLREKNEAVQDAIDAKKRGTSQRTIFDYAAKAAMLEMQYQSHPAMIYDDRAKHIVSAYSLLVDVIMAGEQLGFPACSFPYVGGVPKPEHPPLTSFWVLYSDGSVDCHSMAAGVTLEQARQHYVGTSFTLSDEKTSIEGVEVNPIDQPFIGYYFRASTGCEDRTGPDVGPFPDYMELTYDELRVGPDGGSVAAFYGESETPFLNAEGGRTTGWSVYEPHGKGKKEYWSDIVMYARPLKRGDKFIMVKG